MCRGAVDVVGAFGEAGIGEAASLLFIQPLKASLMPAGRPRQNAAKARAPWADRLAPWGESARCCGRSGTADPSAAAQALHSGLPPTLEEETAMFLQWLIAHDFDAGADAAASAAAELAAGQAKAVGGKGRIVLCHVVNPVPLIITPDMMGLPDMNATLAADVEQSTRLLKAKASALQERFPTLTVEARLCQGPTVPTLLDEAEHQHVDAIAVGSHGRKGVAWALLGSVSEKAVHKSRKPVLVVKVDEPASGIAATA
jgi:nucleotide-binding universal stress UspA family protein